MRIGLFSDMYLPHISGITNHISLYKRRYEELGHEAYVFTFGDLGYHDAEQHVVRTPGLPWGETGWRFALGFSNRVQRLIPTLDVAHVHHPFQSGRLVAPYCRRRHIPLVFTNHTRYDLYSDAYAGYLPRRLRYAYLQRELRTFAETCDLVIAPSPEIAEWLGDFASYPSAEVIPNGLDARPFANPAAPVSRKQLGLAEDDVVFAYVGRLGAEKNTVWLAREFVRATASAPRARLLVVGDGPARRETEALLRDAGLADRVVFAGLQPYDSVPDFEAAADVFVTGSVSEVHPLVVLEAMAAGLPVVAVESPGISGTVADGVTGLLAPEPSDGALAERIAALAADGALRARMGAAAREAAGAYSLERTADVVAARYAALVADAAAQRAGQAHAGPVR